MMIPPVGPNDNDMFRMSGILLSEIRLAPTWICMVNAVEALAAIRKRYESMESERRVMMQSEIGDQASRGIRA